MADQIMAESKPPKPGLLRRILWWLWVILLTALLVLGFVFAAPWKVITLIAIFLAAATILPRVYRKWFWLGVGIVVLAIIIWIFLPDDNKGWKPYQFDKELAQLKAKYAVPDSENAAVIYNQILADWKQKEANEPNLLYDKFDFARRNFWLNKDQPEVAVYMQYYQDTIEKVLQAVSIQRCSFPVITSYLDFGKEMGNLERHPAMRRWAYLLVAAGNNDTAEGNTNEAVEKYLTAIKLGQHQCQQPAYVDKVVGMACESLGLGGINNFVVLGDANEFYLGKLEQAVSGIKHDWNNGLTDFIDLEKIMLKNTFADFLYEVNSKGDVRLSRNPMATLIEQGKEQLANSTVANSETIASMEKMIYPFGWQKKLMKIQTILVWFYAPATPEKLSGLLDASFKKHYTMTKPDFDWSKIPSEVPIESYTQFMQFGLNIKKQITFMAKVNETLYLNAHDFYLRTSAQQRETLLIIALRRYKNAHGHWPESLDDVKTLAPAEVFVDPMNGDSFVYKLTEDNFTLYSKGKNGIDEGGEYDTKFSAGHRKIEIIKDDRMIWPHKSKVSKQQEQKTEKIKE